MKKTVVLILTAFLTSCGSDSKPKITDAEAEALAEKLIEQAKKEAEQQFVEESNWIYESSFDEMAGDSIYFATTTSTDIAEFEFPYQGGSRLSLTIRNKRGENDAYIKISKGQFNSTYNSPNVSIRFDSMPMAKFAVLESSSGDSEIRFFDNEARVVKDLKGKQKMYIECDFYSHGKEVFEFNVENFEWKH